MRARLAAAVGLLALAVVTALVLSSDGDGGEPGGLRLEPSSGEIVVYLEDPEVNVPATADGAAAVTLTCSGANGAELLRHRVPWPFVDTDGGAYEPHVHLSVADSSAVTACSLDGTRGPLAGHAGLAR